MYKKKLKRGGINLVIFFRKQEEKTKKEETKKRAPMPSLLVTLSASRSQSHGSLNAEGRKETSHVS
jgi:hypothetical protein